MRLVAALLLCLAASTCRAADWSIEIAPYHAAQPLKTIRFGETVFYVGLRNISGHSLMLWKDSCSWGGSNLSFEVTRANGQTFRLEKELLNYFSNFPDPQWIAAKGLYSIQVNLNPNWGTFPQDWKDGETVQLRAVYAEQRDATWDMMQNMSMDKTIQQLKTNFKDDPKLFETTKQHLLAYQKKQSALFRIAWIGRVVSPPVTVKLYTR